MDMGTTVTESLVL